MGWVDGPATKPVLARNRHPSGLPMIIILTINKYSGIGDDPMHKSANWKRKSDPVTGILIFIVWMTAIIIILL